MASEDRRASLQERAVGYQTKSLESGFNFTVPTFKPVTGTLKFKDIVPVNIGYGNSMIQLLDDGGACLMTDEYSDLNNGQPVYLQFTYATTEVGAETDGWYLLEDWNFAYPQNDREIPFGQGYLIEGNDDGAALTYSGAVSTTDTEFVLAAGFNYTGNCSPTDIKLKDIVPVNIGYGNSMIQLLDDGGACLMTSEYSDLNNGQPVYLQFTYATTEVGAKTAGWYLLEDWDFAHPQGDYELKAGRGFLIEGNDEGAKITIPSAL